MLVWPQNDDTVWWVPGIPRGKITACDTLCWWFAAAVVAIVSCLIINPIYCRAGSDPGEKRHIIYYKLHEVKPLQPEMTLHGRLRAAGNNLVNAVS